MNWLPRLFLGAFAALKFGKVFLSLGSMLLAVGIYAWLFGWPYALGLVGLLLAMSLGSFIAGRQRGIPMGLPTFIPFVGTWSGRGAAMPDAETQANVGLAAPVAGAIASFACWFVARSYGLDWLLALSYSGFLITLMNCIPIVPFNGGHVMAALSPRLWLLGVPALVWLFLETHSPLMLVFAVLAAPYAWMALRWKTPVDPQARAYFDVPTRTRWLYGAYYLVLVLFLGFMTTSTHQEIQQRLADRPAASGSV